MSRSSNSIDRPKACKLSSSLRPAPSALILWYVSCTEPDFGRTYLGDRLLWRKQFAKAALPALLAALEQAGLERLRSPPTT